METGSSKQIFQQLDMKKFDGNNVVGNEDSNSVCIDYSLEEEEEEEEDSINSISSMSSSDFVEDASSSTSFSSSSSSNGTLYEFSELMDQLPIKRGLSKFYQGKSQSFTSLASVKNLEDLVKKNVKGTNYRIKMKFCKSYGGGLDNGHKSFSPKAKATISKKPSMAARGSFLSSLGKTTSFVSGCGSAMNVQKKFF